MEFKAGSGISQADVDGISAIFITYFRPSGYTMVERTQIDRVIDEQGFQRSCLTERQMVRIGEILNVSKIIIGDVNIVMGQYNVDTRVINVESGTIVATEGASFTGSSYRASMQRIAQNLANKIALNTSTYYPDKPNTTLETSEYVDLGLPSGTLWKKNNEKGMYYSYLDARNKFGSQMPTREQFAELKNFCSWKWNGKGYLVTGDNGNSINLPASGYRDCNGDIKGVGYSGDYWSISQLNSAYAHGLGFTQGGVSEGSSKQCVGLSIRLVKN